MDRHNLWIYMDFLKRKFFLKNEIKRVLLKSIKRSRAIPFVKRYQANYYLSTLIHISSPNYSSNRCIISGRVWSINKRTRINRFILRTKIAESSLPGFRRASW